MATGQLFSRTTQALFYNYKQLPIQRMLDFDFLCGRETPSVAGIINPGSEGFQKLFFGQEEIAIPVHGSIEAACAAHPTADVFINFASFRSAAASSMSALKQPTIRVVAIIAEGVPESDTKHLIAYARSNNKVVIGPATVGGIQAGAFRIGDTAGTIDNIIACKLYRPGSVGFVSKSIKMIVVLGELGGQDEYSLVEALKQGKEPCYAGVPMSSIVEQGYGVGDVISLLWFKRSLPRYCTKFIEICIMLCADHGPCVSGAHNTIVTARAGKDLVSSLVSGLLTIGPRFGGAIDDAARYFKDAYDRGLTPYEFVESMKKKGIRVPGIGHRIKRGDNRDKRVELLQEFARTNFPSVKYMEYAVQVETYTLTKANNLVMNVDGAIGSLFLDLLAGSGMFTKPEIDEIVEIGYLNGLFVLARSIGLIGHTFDQKRLKQPLYRHPWEDVLYTK
ncbi:unnamed protein product [Linum tenue]|uniref:ATP citrate synthase n=1 Tax=Linum tenue TaxID=586396 RepID=A0AAV0P755_9ROSI|nr:unnamed protein product [Linum tenue]